MSYVQYKHQCCLYRGDCFLAGQAVRLQDFPSRQDRTAGLPIWTGQDWRAGDRTVLQDFPSEQDRTGGQETGQDCRSYCLNRTGLEGRKQDSTTKLPIWTGQNWRARDRTGLQDFAYRLDRNGGQ